MPSNFIDADILLRASPVRVVPSAYIFDESEFSEHARRFLISVREDSLRLVVRDATVKDAKQALAPFHAAGFQQSITPLEIINGLDGVCAWVLSAEKTSAQDFLKQLAAVENAWPKRIKHLLFLQVAQPDTAKEWLSGNAEGLFLPFLLCANPLGGVQREERDLARAAIAYTYSSWRKYSCSGNGNLAEAFSLPDERRVLTLGISASEFDVAYHARRWALKLQDELLSRFLKKAKDERPPTLMNLGEICDFLLPEWYFPGEREAVLDCSTEIHSGEEIVRLSYAGHSNQPPWREISKKRNLMHLLGWVREKFGFLELFAFQNTQRFVAWKRKKISLRLWEPIQGYLQLPDTEESLVNIMKARFKFCRNYADTLTATKVGETPGGEFDQDCQVAEKTISAIPNLFSALLRLVLLASGLAGLLVAPLLWGGFSHPLSDGTLWAIALGSGVLTGICFVGVFVHYFYVCVMAGFRVTAAEVRMEKRHLGKIATLASEEVRAQGHEIKNTVDLFIKSAERLESVLSKKSTLTHSSATSPAVGAFLSDDSIDTLVQPRMDELVHGVYSGLRDALNVSKSDKEVVSWDPVIWQNASFDESSKTSDTAIRKLTFDQCIVAMNPAADTKRTLLHNLVNEACKPCWPAPRTVGTPVICFGDSRVWQPYCGQHDTLKYEPLNLLDVLVVNIIPVYEGGVT